MCYDTVEKFKHELRDPRVAFRYKSWSNGQQMSGWCDTTRDEFKKFLAANKEYNGRPNFTRIEVAVIGNEELWIWTPELKWHKYETLMDCKGYLDFARMCWEDKDEIVSITEYMYRKNRIERQLKLF